MANTTEKISFGFSILAISALAVVVFVALVIKFVSWAWQYVTFYNFAWFIGLIAWILIAILSLGLLIYFCYKTGEKVLGGKK